MASSPVAPRSDGECQLGEGSREPIPGIDIGAQFVVAATQVLEKACPALITCADRNRIRPPTGLRDEPPTCEPHDSVRSCGGRAVGPLVVSHPHGVALGDPERDRGSDAAAC
jgi:hypothetical protein